MEYNVRYRTQYRLGKLGNKVFYKMILKTLIILIRYCTLKLINKQDGVQDGLRTHDRIDIRNAVLWKVGGATLLYSQLSMFINPSVLMKNLRESSYLNYSSYAEDVKERARI